MDRRTDRHIQRQTVRQTNQTNVIIQQHISVDWTSTLLFVLERFIMQMVKTGDISHALSVTNYEHSVVRFAVHHWFCEASSQPQSLQQSYDNAAWDCLVISPSSQTPTPLKSFFSQHVTSTEGFFPLLTGEGRPPTIWFHRILSTTQLPQPSSHSCSWLMYL